ncbi:MAG: hypothetical protein AB1467_00640 [Candidatus Diapherotrites archaeon]
MNLENFSLKNIYDLTRILRVPREKIEFVYPQQIIDIMNSTDKKVAVHLYPLKFSKPKKERLLDYDKWGYHQICLAIKDNLIYCCLGHGDSSGSRELHNQMTELLMQNKKLREETPTAVLVTFKGNVMAYYFYKKYAYLNEDIGSNWKIGLGKELAKARIPFSQRRILDEGREIIFKTAQKETIIFRALEEELIKPWQIAIKNDMLK